MVPKKKHQVHPISEDDLVCDTCPTRYPVASSHAETVERARVAGWHIYEGLSVAGAVIRSHLCGDCVHRGAPRRPTGTAVMEGQMDLLGGDDHELRRPGDGVPGPVKRSGKGRYLA